MTNHLVLKICVANPPFGTKVDTVYDVIEKSIEQAEAYRLNRSKVTGAAVELTLVLQATATVATVANLLYNIWKNHKDKGQLYVAADAENRIDIMITETTTKKDLEDFQEKLVKLASSEREVEIYQETMDEVKRTRLWIRTK